LSEECKVCGKVLGCLNTNHLRTHNMTLEEYREKYGGGKDKVKKIARKVNSSKRKTKSLSYQSARTLEELYEMDKTIVIPKKFTRITRDNQALLKDIAEMAFDYKSVSIDVETTGLNPFHDIITDLVITINKEETYSHNYHIPLLHVDRNDQLIPGQIPVEVARDWIRPILQSKDIEKVFFNAYFDCMMFWEVWDTFTNNIAFDGYIAGKLLNENEKSHKLKDLYGKYLAEDEPDAEIKSLGVETFEEQFGKIKFFRVPMNVATCYACKDGYMTRRLMEFQKYYIDTTGRISNVFYNIEMPLVPVLLNMRKEGIHLDLDRAKELDGLLEQEASEIEVRLREIIGDININSPKQLSHKLYKELKLPDLYKGSTKKEALQDLSDLGYEAPGLILAFRGKEKLRSTYTTPAGDYIQKKTGKVHTSFNQVSARTGRFSSNNPNLQNIPARTDKRIRTMFMVEPGYVLVANDFSQIEPRILAHVSQDPVMLEAYRKGLDIYSTMAAEVYSEIEGRTLTPEDCGDGTVYRTNMKTILLGIMYNMSRKGLAKKLRIEEHQAQDIIDSFYSRFKGVAKYERELKRFCRSEGYVETLYGRKRRLPDIWSDQHWIRAKTERQVLNSVIQGTAADIMKLAMLELGRDQQIYDLGVRMLLTVHDEIDSKVPLNVAIEASKLMVEAMLRSWKLSVPIKVDTDIYVDRRWYGECVSLKKKGEEWVLSHNGKVIDEDEFNRLCNCYV